MEYLRLDMLVTNDMARRNLSNREYSKLVGITHPTLALILNNEKPSFETCEKLAPILHLNLETVLHAAGLLPPITIDQAVIDQVTNILSDLPPDKRVEFIEHGLVMIKNARKSGLRNDQ